MMVKSKLVREAILQGILLLMLVTANAVCNAEESPAVINEKLSKIVSDIRGPNKKGIHPYANQMFELGPSAIPEIINLAHNGDVKVRGYAVSALSRFNRLPSTTIHKTGVISALLICLEDKDDNVSRYAFGAISSYPMNILKTEISLDEIEYLFKYAKKRQETSPRAILLIGNLGNKDCWLQLREILEIENKNPENLDTWHIMSEEMKNKTKMALFKLDDPMLIKETEVALRSNNVSSMTLAIERIAYSGKKGYIPELMKLLDDTRDAKDIEKFGTGIPFYMRVSDLAADAILELSDINKFTFKGDSNYRYDQAQIKKIKGQFGGK